MLKNLLIGVILILFLLSCNNKNSDEAIPAFEQVFYIHGNEVQKIHNVKLANDFKELPDSLIIKPGYYYIGEQHYDLTNEGLYRFVDLNNESWQRIVYSIDTTTLISSLCWIISHGNRHNNMQNEELLEVAKTTKLFLTCHYSSSFVHEILNNLNITSRVVLGLTLDDWNDYNNGHTLLEVQFHDGWKLFDIDNNIIFRDSLGKKQLNFVELTKVVKGDNYGFYYISDDIKLSGKWMNNEEVDLTLLGECMLSKSYLHEWYKRVLQLPLIQKNGKYYFSYPDSNAQKRILEYSNDFINISQDSFNTLFYE